MKLSGLHVRVERRPNSMSEVFITGGDPYVNLCLILPQSSVGSLESGACTLEITPDEKAAPVEKTEKAK